MKDWTPIVSIIAIVALELVAVCKSLNGVMLAGSIALIAGLGGYTAKSFKDKVSKPKKEK